MPQVEGIPAQWQRFAPNIGKIPGQVGWTCYGVCFNFDADANMDYMCGVEVAGSAPLPSGMDRLPIAEHHYAVFSHRDHISKIGSTWDAIFKEWMPKSGYSAAKAPQFETYGPDYDPRSGTGLVEIWIPITQ
jgi:AraC family transcriptional regulator